MSEEESSVLTVRTEIFTVDGSAVLVFSKIDDFQFDYQWIDVQTEEAISDKYETEKTALSFKNGYDMAIEVGASCD